MGHWATGPELTYVSDVVEATIAAAERIDDGRAVNVGTTERIKVVEAVSRFWSTRKRPCFGIRSDEAHRALQPRVRQLSRVRSTRWRPLVPFAQGVQRTIDWYFKTHDAGQVAGLLPHALTERTHAPG